MLWRAAAAAMIRPVDYTTTTEGNPMTRKFMLIPVLAVALLAGAAYAKPAMDAAGKCRDNGKFVEAKLCMTAAPAGKCRDMKTKKFAKCGSPGTEPVPQAGAPPTAK
jgi:hypothetical protein